MSQVLTNVVLPPLITSNARRDAAGRLAVPIRRSFARIKDAIDVPKLIETQLTSFEWFQKEGLRELFTEISPIDDFTAKISNSALVIMNLVSRVTTNSSVANAI